MKSGLAIIYLLFVCHCAGDVVRNGRLVSGAMAGAPVAGGDSDVNAYQSAIAAAGSSISANDLTAVGLFVFSAKSNNYWTSLIEVGPLAGNALAAALVKLKRHASAPVTLTNSGFVASEYTTTNGLRGNGTNYLDTGCNWANADPGTGAFGMSFYVGGAGYTNAPASETFMGLANDASPYMIIAATTSPGVSGYLGGVGGSVASISTSLNPPGFYHLERQATNSLKLLIDGTVMAADVNGITISNRSRTIALFAARDSSTASSKVTQPGWFYAIDDGTMSNTQLTNFAADVRTLMLGLGRLRPIAAPMHLALVSGQSLAAGGTGLPLLTTNAYFGRSPLGGPIMTGASPDGQNVLSLLAERSTETLCSAMGALVGTLARTAGSNSIYDLTMLNWAVGGAGYLDLKRGTTAYTGSTNGVARVLTNGARLYNTGLIVPGVVIVHGETDRHSLTYSNDLREWQAHYQADCRAVTGQTNAVKLFHTQFSAWTSQGGGSTNKSPFQTLDAYRADPTNTILVGPKYILPYAPGDGLHLTNSSYVWLGEYYAAVWDKVIRQGQLWQPLYPTNIGRSGAVVTLTFTKTNLVLDTVLISNPGNLGFEWFDSDTSATISSVALVATAPTNQVQITLSGTPTGTKRVRYAFTGTPGNAGGPTSGPRGCLRDNDIAVSLRGNSLYNWCVHFDEACP